MQEVKIIHSLNNPNILRFYEWYETKNHLWLILEICPGGDLCNLIKTEGKFPESSIHDFGRDLLLAMQYIHMAGIIHCDIKPSNILLDENGRIKLGGFSLSLRLQEINDRNFKQYPAERGSPSYMAPELFQEGATFSTASDLWALGCVLYECAMGHSPFVSDTLSDLVNKILYQNPVMPTDCSEQFRDLLAKLLDKNPAQRINWAELCHHPFWEFTLGDVTMPEEPALEAFIKRHNLSPQENQTEKEVNACALSLRESVDVTRLSRIVRSNMEKETEAKEYRVQNKQNNDMQNDVALDPNNMDAELDFRDTTFQKNQSDEASEEDTKSNGIIGYVPEQTMSLTQTPSTCARQFNSPSLMSNGQNDTSPSVCKPSPITAAQITSVDQYEGDDSNTKKDVSKSIRDLIFHKSDSQIRPIVGNKRIEKVPDPRWNDKELPFKSLSVEQLRAQPKPQIIQHLNEIQRVLHSNHGINEKLNVLSYLESLCTDTELVNSMVNSMLSKVLIRMLASTKQQSGLRAKLAQVLGMLLRYATWISDEFMRAGILQALVDAVKDHNEFVKRKSAAALGELLYYMASQDSEPQGQLSKEWEIPPNTLSVLLKLLRPSEDECAQHYAVKAIENLVTQGGDWAAKFSIQEVVNNLMQIYVSGKNEHLKATAASACYRVLRFSPDLVQPAVERVGVRLILKSLKDGNTRIQVSMINILNLALPDLSTRAKAGMVDEQSLVPSLIHLLGNASAVLRAKAMITIALLCRQNTKFLVDFCNLKLLLLLQRLATDENSYVQECLDALKKELHILVPKICELVSLELDQLARRLYSSNGNSVRPGQRSQLSQIGILSHFLSSSMFREVASSPQVIKQLASFIRITAQPGVQFQGLQQFKSGLHDIIRSLNQQEVLTSRRQEIITLLIPQLCYVIGEQSAPPQDQCLIAVILTELMIQFLAYPKKDGRDEELEKSIAEYIIPLLPLLFDKGEHFILQAQKLMVGLLENDSKWIKEICRLDLSSRLLDCLSLENKNNNVHNLWLCNKLITNKAIDRQIIIERQVVQKVSQVLEYACVHKVNPFIEPILELCCILTELDNQENDTPSDFNSALLNNFPQFLFLCHDQGLSCQDLASQCVFNLVLTYPMDSHQLIFTEDSMQSICSILSTETSTSNEQILVTVKFNLLSSIYSSVKNCGMKNIHQKYVKNITDLLKLNYQNVDEQLAQVVQDLTQQFSQM
eukprot:TRINITY_DN398_c1_g1_i10.p1 TRINITY_DN398_c1_g1~~TRINITY_DN398_c1_g1_i10.p1  ORF type:complete len:1216 (-),score=117.54 TRINITY_DN398_c1_g1_i10:293-3940(-)